MRSYIIAILILVSLFSGCINVEDTTVLYATVNITENETDITLMDAKLEMGKIPALKVPRQDQTATYPYIALQVYSKKDIISHISATKYNGTGTHTFIIPIQDGKTPKLNDMMTFELRIFNETSILDKLYFVGLWRWNETGQWNETE